MQKSTAYLTQLTRDSETIMLFARLVKAEAEGEPLSGQLEVCRVVLARRIDPRWPDTVAEVIFQPLQFSCLNKSDPRRPVFFGYIEDRWIELARYFANLRHDPREVETYPNHYHAKHVHPSWADPDKVIEIIGDHIFYRL